MIRGSDLEIQMVKALFKKGAVGFRAPASGTYVLPTSPIPYTPLQKKCEIKIEGIDYVDFGYDPRGYQTADYSGFFPAVKLGRVTPQGDGKPNEFRFVELKTVRLRSSQMTAEDRKIGKKNVNRKSHPMKVTFNLLQKDTRASFKVMKMGKRIRVQNPHYNKLRKSDFCIELQRTWYMSLLMRKNIASMLESMGIKVDENKLPIYGYLQVRFIGADAEIWIRIENLARYSDYRKKSPRDPSHTMLDIIKDENNRIIWKWRKNRSYG